MGSVKIGCTLLAWCACYFCVFFLGEEIAFGVSTTPELSKHAPVSDCEDSNHVIMFFFVGRGGPLFWW